MTRNKHHGEDKEGRLDRELPPHIHQHNLNTAFEDNFGGDSSVQVTQQTDSPSSKKRKHKDKEKEKEGISSAQLNLEATSPKKRRKKEEKEKTGKEAIQISDLDTVIVKEKETELGKIKKRKKKPSSNLNTGTSIDENIASSSSPSKNRKVKQSSSNTILAVSPKKTSFVQDHIPSSPSIAITQRNEKNIPMIDSISLPSPSPSYNDTFTTTSGTVLTFQNAGILLTYWGQSIGQQNLLMEYRNVPSNLPPAASGLSNRAKQRIEAAKIQGRESSFHKFTDNDPYSNTLRECSITLPLVGIIRSSVPIEGGWSNKKLAKQSASFESIKHLYKLGKLDDNLKPITSNIVKPKPSPVSTASIDADIVHDDSALNAHIYEEEKRIMKEIRLTTKSRSTKLWDEQKQIIKSRLPPSPSISSLNGTSDSSTGSSSSSSSAASSCATSISNFQFGLGNYKCKTSSSFWAIAPPFQPDQLYATSLEVILNSPYQEDHKITESARKLCLITSKPMNIFDENGILYLDLTIGDQQPHSPSVEIGTKMRMIDYGKMKSWDDDQLEKALKFTETLLRAQLQKPFRGKLDEVKWLVVPLKSGHVDSSVSTKKKRKLQRRDISWDEIASMAEGPLFTPLHLDDLDNLEQQCQDRMTTSPSEFSERRYIHAVRRDLCPTSPHPTIPDKSIVDVLPIPPQLKYSTQPILELQLVKSPKYGGFVNSIMYPSKIETTFVPAEIVQIHCIPSSIFRMGTILPYIINELDSLLIASELNESKFQGIIAPRLVLQSLTTPASNSSLSRNYERLEFLGDTILKFITTIHFYVNDLCKYDKSLEQVFLDRHVITSNRSLQDNSIKLNLNEYIRNKRFKCKEWLPKDWDLDWNEFKKDSPKRSYNGNLRKTSSDDMEGYHNLGDKVLADVLEAIIGASYLTSRDLDDVITVTHALGIPIKGLHKWSDLKYALPGPPSPNMHKDKVPEEKYMKFFKLKTNTIVGYEFQDVNKVNQILSLDMNEPGRKVIFDRYRMLGNAILDYYIVEYLLDKYPEEGPASMHFMKTSRCTESVRSALSAELGLLDLLRDAIDETKIQINKIRKATKAAKNKADQLRSKVLSEGGDVMSVGLEWWSDIAVAHTTSDPLEALFGAITHDAQFSLEPTRNLFNSRILPFFEQYCLTPKSKGVTYHPKDELIKWLQSRGCFGISIERRFYDKQISMKEGTRETNEIMEEQKVIERVQSGGTGEEEVIITLHNSEITREKVELGLGFKAIKKTCQFALSYLRDQGGLGKICTCPTKKESCSSEETEKEMGRDH